LRRARLGTYGTYPYELDKGESRTQVEVQDFRDFKHAVTGAPLIKLQHPEAETLWGSKHDAAGVECKNCHMPKAQNAQGQTYTSHWQTSPRNYLDQTCLTCHPNWTREEAEYQIDAIQNYTRGKMRKAECWLEKLIDTYQAAKDAGAPESALQEARKQQDTAHVLWEWWTAENSDGFHNPEAARESLAQSIDASTRGIALLEQALSEKRGGPSAWEIAFRAEHGRAPTAQDIADREWADDFQRENGQSPTPADWEQHYFKNR